jgi:hypothetical protein
MRASNSAAGSHIDVVTAVALVSPVLHLSVALEHGLNPNAALDLAGIGM